MTITDVFSCKENGVGMLIAPSVTYEDFQTRNTAKPSVSADMASGEWSRETSPMMPSSKQGFIRGGVGRGVRNAIESHTASVARDDATAMYKKMIMMLYIGIHMLWPLLLSQASKVSEKLPWQGKLVRLLCASTPNSVNLSNFSSTTSSRSTTSTPPEPRPSAIRSTYMHAVYGKHFLSKHMVQPLSQPPLGKLADALMSGAVVLGKQHPRQEVELENLVPLDFSAVERYDRSVRLHLRMSR